MSSYPHCRMNRCKPELSARALLGGVLLLLALAAPAMATRTEKRIAVDSRPVVAVKNDHGKISVKAWKRNEILIIGEHSSDKVQVEIDQMGARVDVVTHAHGQNLSAADLRTDYEITVPEETELQIKNDAGLIVVERVTGDMTFETVKSDVQLSEVAGSFIMVKTVSGSLLCVRCAGRLELSTTSGNLRLVQPVSSLVRAQTGSGSIFFDGDFLAGGKYELKSFTGPIEVRFTDNDSFVLKASSVNGRVDRDPSLQLDTSAHLRGNARPPVSNSLFGTYGTGQARVDLSSFSGTITIRKR